MSKSSHPDSAEQTRHPRPTLAPDGVNPPLTERPPSVSSFEETLPFRTDAELRERYLNFFGGLQLGKLLRLGAELRRAKGVGPLGEST